MNNGEDRLCDACDKPGNTAHDLTWDEDAGEWLCGDCVLEKEREAAMYD